MNRYLEVLRQRWHFTKRLYYLIRYKGYLTTPNIKYLTKVKLGYLLTFKTASSSIYNTLLQKEINTSFEKDLHFHANQHLKSDAENKKDYFIFTFVRNPMERLVSCYQNKIIDDPKIDNNIHYFTDVYFWGYLGKTSSFDDFIRRINKIPNHLLEGHIGMQSDIVFDQNGNSRANFIGKYENITKDFAIIQNKFQLPNLPKSNPSSRKDWRTYYTKDSAKIVIEKYKQDIEAFGYQKEVEDLLVFLENQKV